MTGLRGWWGSSIGQKQVMAVTGVVLAVWVALHMVGNLQVFQGREAINRYAALLQGFQGPLWAMRLGLLAALLLHVAAAVRLTRRNLAARPVDYAERQPQVSTLAARTLRWGGALLLAYIVLHLLTFTVGSPHPDFIREDVYHNVVVAFRSPLQTGFYVLAMTALGLHLYHGSWSIFQSLGSMSPRFNPRHNPLRRGFAAVFAIVVAGVNVTFPIAALAGVVSVG